MAERVSAGREEGHECWESGAGKQAAEQAAAGAAAGGDTEESRNRASVATLNRCARDAVLTAIFSPPYVAGGSLVQLITTLTILHLPAVSGISAVIVPSQP